jgi:hypothetical protein
LRLQPADVAFVDVVVHAGPASTTASHAIIAPAIACAVLGTILISLS